MLNLKQLGREIVNELLELSEVERKDMPQVRDKDVDDVKQILLDNKIEFEEGYANVGDLKATQEDYIPDKVEKFKKSIKSGDFELNPLFVAKEGFIMDGHHRWLAIKDIYGEGYRIPVIKIGLPKEEALAMFEKASDEVKEDAVLGSIHAEPGHIHGWKIMKENKLLSTEVIEYFIIDLETHGGGIKRLVEQSQAAEAQVDDGPATFYKSPANYQRDVTDITERLGWEVVDFMAGDREEYADHSYKYDHVSDVSYGNVGVRVAKGDPLNKYLDRTKKFARAVGMEIVDWLFNEGNKKWSMITAKTDPTNVTEEPLQQDPAETEPLEQSENLDEITKKIELKENVIKLIQKRLT